MMSASLFENKEADIRWIKKIMNFQCFQQENFCLLLIKHILLKKEHDLLFFQLFVSKHFYEYFFLILMYVFVTLKSRFFDFGFKTFKNFFKMKGFFHSKLLNRKWLFAHFLLIFFPSQ